MANHEEIYGDERADRLRAELADFAELVQRLNREGQLLENVSQLLRRMGDLRSELFHYEVRSTYDTPEIAKNRKIVEEAKGITEEPLDDDTEDDEPWLRGAE